MNYLEQLLRGGTPQRPAAYPQTEEDNFALMADAGWFNAPQAGPQVTQFDPMATDSRLGNAPQVEKEKNQLNTLFQGAIFAGDLEKAARLAVTAEQQALLGVAYGDRMSRQAGTPATGMNDYTRMQQATAMQSRADQDRAMKQAEMAARIRASDANANKDNAQARVVGMPRNTGQMQITEIVDPADPSKMLRIDARVYRGGSVGSPGVVGASGKEPSAAKREDSANSGRDGLAADLQLMRDAYAKLKEAKAIPSTENGTLSNVRARIQASGPGEFVGGAVGTEEQVAREEIKAAKRRLLSSIKNITGATAQEMNSNVELKTWMDSLGDTSKIVEGNLNILDAIENKYIKAKDYKNTGKPGTSGVRRYNPATGRIE